MAAAPGFLRRNGLFLTLFGIFLALWFGQSVVGQRSSQSEPVHQAHAAN